MMKISNIVKAGLLVSVFFVNANAWRKGSDKKNLVWKN